MVKQPDDEFQRWHALIREAAGQVDSAREDWRRHLAYVGHLGLRADDEVATVVDDHFSLAQRIALAALGSSSTWEARGRYRLLLQELGAVRTALQWCSPSDDQSLEVMFLDSGQQRNLGVSYARYGFPSLRELEQHLLSVLGFDATRTGLLATSSGMSAYQLIESFLVRHVLGPGDTAAYAPYIYFEAYEQAAGLAQVRHITAASYEAKDLIRTVESSGATVLFVDPVANVATMPVVDLRDLAERTRGGRLNGRCLVIDGTLISGGLDPFSLFSGEGQPYVLYYESAGKYLQLGLDLQMAGLCAASHNIVPALRRIRRNTGSIMGPRGAASFPLYDRALYLARMRTLTRNAERLVARIEARPAVSGKVSVGFPRSWRDLGWAHGGGIVAMTFRQVSLNSWDSLNRFIESLLKACRERNLALTKGASFGFSTTRVSAASALDELSNPFLRFSVGEEDERTIDALCSCVVDTLELYVNTMS